MSPWQRGVCWLGAQEWIRFQWTEGKGHGGVGRGLSGNKREKMEKLKTVERSAESEDGV